MSSPQADPTEALDAFMLATRRLAEFARDRESSELETAIADQLEHFQALERVLAQGGQPRASHFAEAIDEAERTLRDITQSKHEVHKEIGDLRSARNRTLRRLEVDDAAQFVSRRV